LSSFEKKKAAFGENHAESLNSMLKLAESHYEKRQLLSGEEDGGGGEQQPGEEHGDDDDDFSEGGGEGGGGGREREEDLERQGSSRGIELTEMKHNPNNNNMNTNNKQSQEQQPHHQQQTKKTIDLMSFEENHTGKHPSDYTNLPEARSDISV
jgi:hypothetical protein